MSFKRCKTVASAFAEGLPGTRRRSWTFPWSSLCSRGNIARFRRRWYEMAETACLTEAQRLGYVEATHLFCHGPGLLVWGKQDCVRRKTGLKSCFSPKTKNKNVRVVFPAGSKRRLRVDTVGINRRGVSAIYGFIFFFLGDMFVVLLLTIWK